MTIPTTLPMLEDKPLLLIMDGHALVHRAWHAIREPLNVRSTGEEVRAVFGFLNSFIKTISDRKPTHIIVTFDLPKPTFRHKAFNEYKAHRPPTPPELRGQFARIRQLMEAFGVPIFEQEGFEADDLIGTLCRQAEEQEIDTIVLTGDTDTLQLVSPYVRVLMSVAVQKKSLYDEGAVRERYGGLGPESIAEIKALEGDTSDNIPGVPGIGRKTAIKLLSEFGSLEGIYENLEDVTPPRAKKSLTENREIAERALFLTTILRDAPVTLDVEASEFWKFDRSKVVDFLKELEFFSMVSRIPNNTDGEQLSMAVDEPDFESAPVDYHIVDTEDALEELAVELSKPQGFSFDTETDSIDPMLAQLVGLSFSNSPQKAWYVPVGHNEGKQIPKERVLGSLGPILTDPDIPKVAHNANYDMMVLENQGVTLQGLELDTMLAAHASGRKSVGLKALALEMFHEEMMPITDLIGKGRKQITMAEVEIEKAAPYAAADADFTERLRGELSRELEERDLRGLMDEVETPLVQVLVRMQRDGVDLDVDLLKRMSADLSGQLDDIQNNMYSVVGHEFNLNSSQQLSGVLFDELHLPPTKRTKTGHSTDAASLDGLKAFLDSGKAEGVDPKSYEVLDSILEYRQLSKIKSTYVDALPGLVNPNTGRIHTRYNQVGSATGRVSSNDPNVQNIPVRTELGRQVRRAFVAEGAPEWSLLAADYSQIELRVLAHISKDPALIEAFHRGEDIHSATSSMVYEVPIDEVTADQRRFAKILNFGVLYGLTAFGISRQTDLSPDQGQHFIDVYFEKYPHIRQYTDETKEKCRALGYVQTVLGRRRYLPDITSRNFNVRAGAERAAINMPIQGTAADIIKIAMIRIMERMDDLGMRSKMILQVHDELIFEVPSGEMDQMQEIIMELMPSALTLNVPLGVELKSGYNWGDME
ncbi:MAG: DNA polymerase I [SAR202 cluster bacterium]|jgi:DNA polymerase-1|nr:DNA polymerase I [SAR202 cluster bacterium]MDP6512106.1 DNA polymerase I [SAR202 cluster bacterium]MDP6713021.1 DNA polymerase I [SAR202 cluster bacterium]